MFLCTLRRTKFTTKEDRGLAKKKDCSQTLWKICERGFIVNYILNTNHPRCRSTSKFWTSSSFMWFFFCFVTLCVIFCIFVNYIINHIYLPCCLMFVQLLTIGIGEIQKKFALIRKIFYRLFYFCWNFENDEISRNSFFLRLSFNLLRKILESKETLGRNAVGKGPIFVFIDDELDASLINVVKQEAVELRPVHSLITMMVRKVTKSS